MTTQLRRTLLRFALGLVGLICLGQSAQAQREYPQEEFRYKIPPAAVAFTAPAPTFARTVLVTNGDTALYRVTISAGTAGPLSDSITPSTALPDNLDGIWSLSRPDPQGQPGVIIGLISIRRAQDTVFAVMKSNDYGMTWTVTESPALADAQFVVSAKRNYWKHGLSRMQWLADGQHGWIYGRGGIVRTVDGGDTWELMYKSDNGGNNVEMYEWVSALAFRDSIHGAAVLGLYSTQSFKITSDGGKTWTQPYSLGANRTTNLTWIDGEYRSIAYDRNIPFQSNMTLFKSNDMGQSWTTKPRRQIGTALTNMDEIHWFGQGNGVLVMRHGIIWHTSDGGSNWDSTHGVDDPTEPVMPFTDNHFGTGTGYGQTSAIVDVDLDYKTALIFKAVDTLDNRYLTFYTVYNDIPFAGVEDNNNPASTIATRIAPNPTSGVPSITLTLKEPAHARIVINSMMGAEVINTDLGILPTGERTLPLQDVGRLPAGTYTYTLRAGAYQSTGTLTVTR